MDELERRTLTATDVTLREEGDTLRLEGYAAMFGSWSEDLGGFREMVEPGAFAQSLAERADVVALQNHDANYVLGRTTSGTLSLMEDARGLRASIVLPPTSYARDLHALVQRGDVQGMSFGFTVNRGGDQWSTEEGQRRRRLRSVRLFDVSVVANPAYRATVVAARALELAREGGEIPDIPAEPSQAAGPAAESDQVQVRLDALKRRLEIATVE
jgi:uncharacterized protein